MSHTDEIRTGIHDMWASVSEGWETHAEENDARAMPITTWMLDRTVPREGERVLELACGPGGTGLAAAERVGPSGEVVLSDVAAEMAAVAGRRAGALGLTQTRTAVRDIEAIDEADASYDVVLCREGLMFTVDPRRGASEIGRVLRPGGRVAIAVWGPRAENPWLGIVLDVVGDHLGMTLPPPGTPGPFSLSDADEVAAVLTDGGLVDVEVDRVSVPYDAVSVDRWWSRTCACAGPLAQLLAALPDEAKTAIAERARDAVEAHTVDGLVHLPGLTLAGFGRRAP